MELESKLSHSRAAYLFAVKSLPSEGSGFPIKKNGFLFSSQSEVKSMLIELGWSFYCRYEGCLEAYIKRHGIKLSKKKTLKSWLEDEGSNIPPCYSDGLEFYRKIRNYLHHEDGATFDNNNEEDKEIHILPEHMENFYNLFIWCSEEIEKHIKDLE